MGERERKRAREKNKRGKNYVGKREVQVFIE
jgi:hypothetical protein